MSILAGMFDIRANMTERASELKSANKQTFVEIPLVASLKSFAKYLFVIG